MRRLIFLCVAMLVCALATAQSNVVLNWARTELDAGSTEQEFVRVEAHPNGNFVVIGWDRPLGGFKRAMAKMISPAGVELWRRTFVNTDSGGGDVQFDQIRILSNGDIYVTGIGSVCLISRMRASDGLNLVTTWQYQTSFASALSPECHAYFAGHRVELIDTSSPGITSREYRQYLRSTRISNTGSSFNNQETYIGSGSYFNAGLTFVDVQYLRPEVKWAFGPGTTHMLAATYFTGSQDNGNTFNALHFYAASYGSTGTVLWTNTGGIRAYSQNRERLTRNGYEGDIYGLSPSGNLVFNYSVDTFNPDGSVTTNDYAQQFNGSTGALTIVSPDPNLYTDYVNQNGFTYRYSNRKSPRTEAWTKTPLNGSTVLTIISGQGVSRLPFQTMSASVVSWEDFNLLFADRFQDSNGSLIDSFSTSIRPDSVTGLAQNGGTGHALIIGKKRISDTQVGAFLLRLSQAPVANGNSYTTTRNTPLIAPSVLANDRFAQGLSPQIVNTPINGTLFMNPDGTFRYVPRAGYTGSDTFRYRLQRPTLPVTAPVTVFISITQ